MLQMQNKLTNNRISYTLKTSRTTKRLRLAIRADGSILVTAPTALRQNVVEKFILQKTEWILGKLDYFCKLSRNFENSRDPLTRSFKPKESNSQTAAQSKAQYLKHKQVAQKLAEAKVTQFNQVYKFEYNKISIKNQKTRWGSCSKKGNLNFNYKIALLTERQAEYIVVHEICHLGEFNHSAKFWNLVARTIPEYLEIRRQIRHRSVEETVGETVNESVK